MKKLFFITTFAIIGCVVIYFLAILGNNIIQNREEASPIVVETNYDFGIVHPGESRAKQFVITNRWHEAISIDTITSTCGCTKTSLEKNTLAPGDSTTIDVHVRTKPYAEDRRVQVRVHGIMGKNENTVIFNFNLVIKSREVIKILTRSKNIKFGSYSSKEFPQTIRVRLQRGGYPIDWDTITCESKDPKLDTKLINIDTNNWDLQLTLKPIKTYGSVKKYIDFHFWKQGKKLSYRLRKPVHVSITGPIDVSSRSLLFGSVAKGEIATKLVRIISHLPRKQYPVSIRSISGSGLDNIDTRIKKTDNDTVIEVSFLAKGKEGCYEGDIIVSIQAGEEIYKVRIEYLAYIIARKDEKVTGLA